MLHGLRINNDELRIKKGIKNDELRIKNLKCQALHDSCPWGLYTKAQQAYGSKANLGDLRIIPKIHQYIYIPHKRKLGMMG